MKKSIQNRIDDLKKSRKPDPIGTVRDGRKKIADDKWVAVKTKEELHLFDRDIVDRRAKRKKSLLNNIQKYRKVSLKAKESGDMETYKKYDSYVRSGITELNRITEAENKGKEKLKLSRIDERIDLLKAHKYIKRVGSSGNYKYTYKEDKKRPTAQVEEQTAQEIAQDQFDLDFGPGGIYDAQNDANFGASLGEGRTQRRRRYGKTKGQKREAGLLKKVFNKNTLYEYVDTSLSDILTKDNFKEVFAAHQTLIHSLPDSIEYASKFANKRDDLVAITELKDGSFEDVVNLDYTAAYVNVMENVEGHTTVGEIKHITDLYHKEYVTRAVEAAKKVVEEQVSRKKKIIEQKEREGQFVVGDSSAYTVADITHTNLLSGLSEISHDVNNKFITQHGFSLPVFDLKYAIRKKRSDLDVYEKYKAKVRMPAVMLETEIEATFDRIRREYSEKFKGDIPLNITVDMIQKEAEKEVSEKVKYILDGEDFEDVLNSAKGLKKKRGPRKPPTPAELMAEDASIREGGKSIGNTTEEYKAFFAEKAKVRGVQFGEGLSKKDTDFHLRHCGQAFSDLADIIDLPEEMISFNGRLGIAFGARGRRGATAHYESTEKVINITKDKGSGSLAHEWWHMFDNILFTISPKEGTRPGYGLVNYRNMDAFYASERASGFAKDRPELSKAFSNIFNNNGFKDFATRVAEYTKKNNYTAKQQKYWSSTREITARAFEGWIERKLALKGRKNTYLTKNKRHELWPTLLEIEDLSPYFEEILEIAKNTGLLKKAMEYFSNLGTIQDRIDLLKSHKYIKREGSRGNYKYTYKDGEKQQTLTFSSELVGHHNDQSDMVLIAKNEKGKIVGKLEYALFQGEAHVSMVEIKSEYQRKGYATRLYQELAKEMPYEKIKPGMQTSSGSALRTHLDKVFDYKPPKIINPKELAAEFGGKLLDARPGQHSGNYVYVEFNDADKANKFKDKAAQLGAESIDQQESKGMVWIQIDDLPDLEKSHKYIKREGGKGNYKYTYKDGEGPKSKKPEEKRPESTLGRLEQAVILLKLGEALYNMDTPHEFNRMGMNKLDWAAWGGGFGYGMGTELKGQIDSGKVDETTLYQAKRRLKKYKRQLVENFGAEAYKEAGLLAFTEDPVITLKMHPKFGSIMFPILGRIKKDKFKEYLAIHKERGFKFDGQTKSWFLTDEAASEFKFAEYQEKLLGLGIVVSEGALNPEHLFRKRTKKDQETKQKEIEGDVNKVIEGIANRTVTNMVAVKRDKDGKISFYAPYSTEFNEIFSNRSGVLSGITEYNPRNHARQTLDINLAVEAMEKIRERMPDFKIVDEGIKEAFAEHQRIKEGLKAPIPEVAKKLNPKYQLFDFQNAGVRFFQKTNGNALLGDEMGTGKAQPLYSKILTPNGWKPMGEIQVGDVVVGSNGNTTKVLGVFPQGKRDIYRVIFNDGSYTDCDNEHLWAVNTAVRKWRGNDYQIQTLSEIRTQIKYNNGNSKHFIPLVEPINFVKKELEIDPYLLGALLGDGCIRYCTMFSTADLEMLDILKSTLPENYNIRKKNGDNYDYIIAKPSGCYENAITKRLKNLSLFGTNSKTKFIPEKYKYSSIEDRVSLLQGLLDTDGSTSKNVLEYGTVSENLKNDVLFLVQSLGGIASVSKKKLYTGSTFYRLNIKLPSQIKPFRLTRKMEKYIPKTKYLPKRRIEEVVYVGKYEAQCIKVDALDELYITDNFIVTHNTLMALAWAASEGKRVLVVCPKTVRRTWLEEAEKFFPEYFKGKELIPANLRKDKVQPNLTNMNIATVNYDSLEKFLPAIEAGNFDTIVVDESHRIKNAKAKQTQLVTQVAKTMKHKILLSGTAVKNKKDELFTQLDIIQPGRFSSKTELKYKTIGGLWNEIQDVYLARTKKDVLKDLPDKTTQIIKNEMGGLPDIQAGDQIGDFSKLRGEIAEAKTPLTVDFIKEILQSSDSKVLVFSESVAAMKKIKEEFGENAIMHYGQMADEKRESAKKTFQDPNSKPRIFVSTRQSLAVGATLTAADKVVFNDLPWTAADLLQAEDRTHRIGQKNSVNIYWVTAKGNAFDENVSEIVKKKYELNKKSNQGKQLSKEEREWMEKPVSMQDIMNTMQGTDKDIEKAYEISPEYDLGKIRRRIKNMKNPVYKKVEEFIEKGRKPMPVGTKSGNMIKMANGKWEYIKKEGEHQKKGRPKGSKDKVEKLGLASATEDGVQFETGKPVTFNFVRNTTASPKPSFDDTFQQKIEPAGRFMTFQSKEMHKQKTHEGMIRGEITFKKPLVLYLNTGDGRTYDNNSWKARLSETYGKKGKALSKELAKKGFDGIVTVEKHRGVDITSEIVDLRFLHTGIIEKSFQISQRIALLKSHKYIKREGGPGNYKYWYKDPSTGKLTEGKEPDFKKKGEFVTKEEVKSFIANQKEPYKTYVKQLEDSFRKLEGVKFSGSRLKATESLLKKMHGRFKEKTLSDVKDVVAARIIVGSVKEQKDVFEKMKKSLNVSRIAYNIEKARSGGYRAIHIGFIMPGGSVSEYQLKTLNQQIFSRFAHDTVYKPSPKYAKLKSNPDVEKFLDKLSDYLYNIDVMRKNGKKPQEPKVMTDLGLKFDWNWLKTPPKGIEKGGW